MNYQMISRNNEENYKVSVIVPIYNVEEYLTETLSSLVNQSLDQVEVILIDDGSTDHSDKIIRAFLSQYKSFVYIKQNNSGPGQARNVGIEFARGTYISFVDSDDLLPPDALETMYNAAVKEQADIVTGSSISFNSKRSWYIASHVDKGVYKPGSKTLIRNPELLYSLGPCNKLFRTSLIKYIRFPQQIQVTEDHPFVLEAYLKASTIFTVDKVIYQYRRRETEENMSLSQSVQNNSLGVLKDIMNSLRLSDDLWDKYVINGHAREETKVLYYNRMLWADIWPALNQAIRSKDNSIQYQVMHMLSEWLDGFTPEFFNKVTACHHIFTYELVLRFAMFDRTVHQLYLRMITLNWSLMDPGVRHQLEVSKYKVEVRAVKRACKTQTLFPIKNYLFRSRMKKVINTIKRLVSHGVVRRVFYPAFKKLPVKKKILFASNKMTNLEGSYKYIFQKILLERPNYETKVYFKKTRLFREFVKYFYDIATAKYIILDDYYRPFYNLTFRKETEIIQIWHAAGAFKKFGFSSITSEDSNTEEFERRAHHFYTKAVVTGDEVVPKYAEAFNMSEKNIYPLGLARTDLFFNNEEMMYLKDKYLGKYPQLRDKKVITYAPTFRGVPKKRGMFTLHLDINKMAMALRHDYVLVLKLHPSVTKQPAIPNELKDFVLNLSNDDMNHLLAITDVLISDYSSLIFEFALLNKPMVFFSYDLDQYIDERGFYYDYEQFVPGPIVRTTGELIQTIQENQFDLSKIEAFKTRFFNDLDGHATDRFVDTLIE